MLYTAFDNFEDAREYQMNNGGWVYISDEECIWFNARCYIPSMIRSHRATQGLNGEILGPVDPPRQ